MRNIGLKILSLLIAVLLANYVYHRSNNTQISFLVPIEIANLPAEKIIVWPLTRQTTVTIKGPSHLVSRIAAAPPGFKVQVPSDVKNHFSATLSSSDLKLPSAVDVVSVSPTEFEFTLDDLASKVIPVTVPKLGDLDGNLLLKTLEFEPRKVTISGPQTELQQIDAVETRPLDLRTIRETVRTELVIRRPGIQTRLNPEQVVVTVEVEAVVSERVFKKRKVTIRSERAEVISIKPTEVDLVVQGQRQLIESLSDQDLLPYLELKGEITSGEQRLSVELPNGISLVEIRPAQVLVVKEEKGAN